MDNEGMELTSTILIVDDDRDIRTLLADYLESNGYRALCAPDGAAIVAAVVEAQLGADPRFARFRLGQRQHHAVGQGGFRAVGIGAYSSGLMSRKAMSAFK